MRGLETEQVDVNMKTGDIVVKLNNGLSKILYIKAIKLFKNECFSL
jgi:hypothetical protein